MSALAKIPLSSLARGELEALAERLLAENDALKQAVAELKAEVATLEGVKGRPEVKPSGMEKGAGSEPGATNRGRGGRGKADRLTVDEERVVEADVPAGSRFKGYEDFRSASRGGVTVGRRYFACRGRRDGRRGSSGRVAVVFRPFLLLMCHKLYEGQKAGPR